VHFDINIDVTKESFFVESLDRILELGSSGGISYWFGVDVFACCLSWVRDGDLEFSSTWWVGDSDAGLL